MFSKEALRDICVGGIVFCVLLLVRSIPFWQGGLELFGYDYGFYRYAYLHLPVLSWSFSSYSSPIFWLGQIFHLPPEPFLPAMMLAASIILGICILRFFKHENLLAGICALLLLALSVPQQELYTMFLWKNVWGMILLLLAYTCLQEKKYWSLVLVSAILGFTHKTTGIIYGVSLLAFFSQDLYFKKFYWRMLSLWLVVLGLGLVGLFLFRNLLTDFLTQPNSDVIHGLFLSEISYLRVAWPYVFLGALGAGLAVLQKKHLILVCLLLASLAWIIFGLPFYNRVIVYADLCFILFTGYGLVNLPWPARYQWWLGVGLALLMIFLNYKYFFNPKPLVQPPLLQEIADFGLSHPQSFVLAVDGQDAPWLLGYLQHTGLAAPGLFDDKNSYSAWQQYWQGTVDFREFYGKYPAPLYVYRRSATSLDQPCLREESTNFYKVVCE